MFKGSRASRNHIVIVIG